MNKLEFEIHDGDNLVAKIELDFVTKICYAWHVEIQPAYRHQGYIYKIADMVYQKAKQLGISVLIGTIAANNFNTLNAVKNLGYTVCGCIPNAIIWDDVLTDLIIFQKEVK